METTLKWTNITMLMKSMLIGLQLRSMSITPLLFLKQRSFSTPLKCGYLSWYVWLLQQDYSLTFLKPSINFNEQYNRTLIDSATGKNRGSLCQFILNQLFLVIYLLQPFVTVKSPPSHLTSAQKEKEDAEKWRWGGRGQKRRARYITARKWESRLNKQVGAWESTT